MHDRSDNPATGANSTTTDLNGNGCAPTPDASRAADPGSGLVPDASRGIRQGVERAEVVVERVSAWVGNVTAVVGVGLLWFGSRVREEAEDFWAEAQNIRRGDKS